MSDYDNAYQSARNGGDVATANYRAGEARKRAEQLQQSIMKAQTRLDRMQRTVPIGGRS